MSEISTETTEIVSTPVDQGNETPAAVETTEVSTPEPQVIASKLAEPAAPTTEQTYQPNLKFKIKDKELDFDEWAKNAVKDPETEKGIRELYEKGYGIEEIKQDRQTLRSQLVEAQDKIKNTDQALDQLGSYVAKGDFDTFFAELKIPEDKILQYAIQLAERRQWSPEQQAQWQASRDATQRASFYENRAQQLEARQQTIAVQQREYELTQVMSKPDISPTVQAYNSRMENPGAFRELVLNFGQAAAARGMDIPAEQAVNEALRYLRGAGDFGIQSQQGAVVQTQQQKPVIPNIQGRGTSPVKPAVKSLADIKKLAQEREAQGI